MHPRRTCSVARGASLRKLTDFLTERGEQGWELVASYPYLGARTFLIFKRRKEER